jgi:hypothetical protein
LDPFFQIVEQRIAEAERDGAFAELPGRGRPLQLDDLSLVPEELRASWILLKSHGFLPPELEARREWVRLCDLVAACADPGERGDLRRGAHRAWLRYRFLMEQSGLGRGLVDYRDELLERLGRPEQ